MTAVPVALGIVALVCAGIGVSLWVRRGARAAPAAFALGLATCVWSLGYMWEIVAAGVPSMLLAAQVQYTVIPFVPVGALWLALFHARAVPRRLEAALAASLALPLLTSLIAWTNGWHGLLWSDATALPAGGFTVLGLEHGRYFRVHVAYSYGCLLVALALVIGSAFRTRGLWRRQTLAVVAGMGVPWVANLLYVAGLSPFAPFDPTPFALAVATAAHGLAADNLRLFSLVPVARDLVLEAVEDGIVVLDEAERVVDLNRAAIRVLLLPATGSVGRDGRVLLGEFAPVLDVPVGGDPVRISPTTGVGTFDCRCLPVARTDGRAGPVVVLLRDVTTLASANEELERTRAHLEDQLRNAQKMQGLGRFMGGIAHDLNNLLTAILGFSEMAALEIDEGSPAREDLDQVLAAGTHAKRLVSQILRVGRESKGERGTVCLTTAIEDAVALLRAVVPDDVEIVTELAPRVPEVYADATQLQQVLMNLCVNAAHAMPAGGRLTLSLDASADGWPGSMGVPTEEVGGGRVRLRVRDTGVGMDPETAARIFEPFFSTKGEGRGTGLGLSVVKGIVEEHEGEITVQSVEGLGTTFTIRLPDHRTASAPAPDPTRV